MRSKSLYEDDLIEPTSKTLSSGILFMSKPYNVTAENIEVFERLANVKAELNVEVKRIELAAKLQLWDWVRFLALVGISYAFISQAGDSSDVQCRRFLIYGIGFLGIILSCIAYVVYTDYQRMSTITMLSKPAMEKHKQLIVEMNWERRKMVLHEGNLTHDIPNEDRVQMENRVDRKCKDIYSPVSEGVRYSVTVMFANSMLVIFRLVEVLIALQGRCGWK